jgi:hypothetical protein
MGVSGQRHAPAALYPREMTLGTHCTGGWVGLRAIWTQRLEEKSFLLCRGSNVERPVVQPVARHYTDWASRHPPTVLPLCIVQKIPAVPADQTFDFNALPRSSLWLLNPWLEFGPDLAKCLQFVDNGSLLRSHFHVLSTNWGTMYVGSTLSETWLKKVITYLKDWSFIIRVTHLCYY